MCTRGARWSYLECSGTGHGETFACSIDNAFDFIEARLAAERRFVHRPPTRDLSQYAVAHRSVISWGVSLDALLQRLQYWNAGVLDATVERDVRAAPERMVEEAIAQLPAAAAAYTPPTSDGERPLDAMSRFMPMNEPYSQPTTYRFRALVFFVGSRRAPGALVPLLEVVRDHALDDVRLIAGHGIVATGDRDANETVGELARAATPGRFRLWCGTRFAIEGDASVTRSEAFDQIADRLASRADGLDDRRLLHAALDAAHWHHAMDPRWAELAARVLERASNDSTAKSVMARVGDRRAIPSLLADLAHPYHNTVLDAVEKLHELLGPGVVDVVMPYFRRTTHQSIYISLFRRVGTPAALAALRDYASIGSHLGKTALAAVLARDPSPPTWMRIVSERKSTTLSSRAARLETDTRAAFATAPPTKNRAVFAAWVRTQPTAYKSALFSLFDGEEPAWLTLQDRWELEAIRRRRP